MVGWSFVWQGLKKHECNIEIQHDTRPHTSIIIGFPSFMAFFKSPAKPSKRQYKVRGLSYKVTKRNQWSDYSQICPDKISMTFAEQSIFSFIKHCIPFRTTLHSLQNSVISSSGELKSRAQTGIEVSGALHVLIYMSKFESRAVHKYLERLKK